MIVVKSGEHSIVHAVMLLFSNIGDFDKPETNSTAVMLEVLVDAGFPKKVARQAVHWINSIVQASDEPIAISKHGFRVYEEFEHELLGRAVIAKLYALESEGVLDINSRELVIDRLCALHDEKIDEHLVVWVALIVLYYTSRDGAALASLENSVLLSSAQGVKH